jgi:hypothetical protein
MGHMFSLLYYPREVQGIVINFALYKNTNLHIIQMCVYEDGHL